MKLFIWEGAGISSSYHDDGTLVVLAETPEQAREVAMAQRRAVAANDEEFYRRQREIRDRIEAAGGSPDRWHLDDPEGREIWAGYLDEMGWWDGSEEALSREPDRVLGVDTPCIVAFNGGGYD